MQQSCKVAHSLANNFLFFSLASLSRNKNFSVDLFETLSLI